MQGRSLWLATMLGLAMASPTFAQVFPSPTFQNTTTLGTATFSGPVQFGDSGGTQFAGAVLNVPTFSALRSFQADNLTGKTRTVHTEGYAAASDGGGATYDWDPASTCTTNAGNVVCVLPTGTNHTTTGRWELRMSGGIVDARVGGVKCDGVTDDSAALNSLIAQLSAIGGGTVVLPATNATTGPNGCVISGANLLMRQGVNLRGAVNPWSGTQAYTQAYNSAILLDPTRTITMTNGSTLSDLLVWRLGLAQIPTTVQQVFTAVDQWASENSVAVTLTSSSTVERVRIIGFNLAFKQVGGGGNWVRDVQFDTVNGIDRGGGNAVTLMTNVMVNEWWTPGFGGRTGVVSATPTAGTGYVSGDTVQPSGGTCTIRPSFTVTASGGTPTALTPTNVGDCTVSPTGTAFTGGAGSGLKATINWRTGGYRPGTGIYEHDGVGLIVTNFFGEAYQTAIRVNNSVAQIIASVMEGPSPYMPWTQAVGIQTDNCSMTEIIGTAVTAHYDNLRFNAASDQSGATCNLGNGNMNSNGITKFIGGFVNGSNPGLHSNLVIGPSATALMSETRISSGNLSSAADVIVGANAEFTALGLIFNVIAIHRPWLTADPTATISTCGGTADATGTLAQISYADTCLNSSSPMNLTSALTIGTNTQQVSTIINGPAGSNRYLQWNSAGVRRWDFRTDATTEDGAATNDGSKFILDASVDAGTFNFQAFSVDRQFGAWTFNTASPIVLSGNDPGTQGSTMAMRWNQYYSGTTTGTPLTFNQIWIRRDDVNDSSQGQAFVVQDDAGCSGAGTCAPTANITASISGNILNVTAVSSGGPINAGDFVQGAGVVPTHINAFGSGGTSGTGSVGTYQLDNSLSGTVTSKSMTTITPIVSRGRQALVGVVNVTGPVSPRNGAGTYNAGRTGLGIVGDGGGTLTTRGFNTQTYNWINVLNTGTTNWDAAGIGQSNLYITKGNNLAVRYHTFYSTTADDGTQGGQADFFLQVGAGPYTTNTQPGPYFGMAMQTAFMLGCNCGSIFPLDENNGEIMMATPYLGALITPRPPMKTWRGFDLANIQFSDCVLCLPGNRTMGNGDAAIKRLGITDGTNGPVLDGTYSTASVTAIGSSTSGFNAGEQYPTRLGGYVIVDSVDGTTHVTAAHYGVPPYRKAGEVVQVAWAFVQNPAASGQAVLFLRNTTPNIGIGDSVVALGPAAACNGAIPAGTTVVTYAKGTGDAGLNQSITLSANLTAAMSYGCMLSFRRTMLSSTDTIVAGWTGSNFVLNISWTAPTRVQLGASVDTVIGPGTAMTTSATGGGFLHLPFMTAAPNGTPSATAGPACVWNDTTFTLNCYSPSAGAWKHITLSSGGG